MNDESQASTSKWKKIQRIIVIIVLTWAVVMYAKNVMGPDNNLIIGTDDYVIPEGCSINGIYKEGELIKFIQESGLRSYKNISRKCLVEKYRIPQNDSKKYNFFYVRSFGRNYYRIGNVAINIDCKKEFCKPTTGYYRVFHGSIKGNVK